MSLCKFLFAVFHEYHSKHGGDPLGIEGETVTTMANRYRQSVVIEFYEWCDLRAKYIRVLESLMRHLKKAYPQQEPVVFTAEDLDQYQAGCEEKMESMKTIKFNHFRPKLGQSCGEILRQAIGEACDLRFKVKTFLPKPEDLVKGKGKKGARGKKNK